MRTAGPAAPPTHPSSAAAAEWPIAGRNASLIISRFKGSDDRYLRCPGHRSPPWTGTENLAASKYYGFVRPKIVRDGALPTQGRCCATRQIAALHSARPATRAADHF